MIRGWLVLALSSVVVLMAACGSDSCEVCWPSCTDADEDRRGDVDLSTDVLPDVDAPDSGIGQLDVPDVAEGDSTDAQEIQPDDMTDTESDVEPPTQPSLFAEGCPVPGKATAKVIKTAYTRMEGVDAISTAGDLLLMNEHAAFVIEAPGKSNAYYLYGGIPVDAVALNGCAQAGPERFGELGIMMGTLNPDIYKSTLRSFKGESAEVVSDGADGGPAVVKVAGVDETFWLLELELLRQLVFDGKTKPLSSPMGLEISVQYTPAPDSPVLQIDVTYKNTGNKKLFLLCGAEAQFGDTATASYYTKSTFDLGSFALQQGVPWIGASQGDGGWVFAIKGGNLGTLTISGVTALFDVQQMESDSSLAPAGQQGDTKTVTYLLSVGPTDLSSAVAPLCDANPEPLPETGCQLVPLFGQLTHSFTGEGLPGTVLVEGQDEDGVWHPLTAIQTTDFGAYDGLVPWLGPDIPLRIRAEVLGWPQPPTVEFTPETVTPVDFALESTGTIRLDVRDHQGNPMPAKVILWQNGSMVRRFYVGLEPLETNVLPGEYHVSVSRGMEYDSQEFNIVVTANQVTPVAANPWRSVDTSGWMAVDTHVHAAPSPDSVVPVPHRILTAAAEGLDVVVSTDHEFVSDWALAIEEAGLTQWIAAVPGEEATATLPEHINAFPLEPRFDVDARGGPLHWYGMDLEQIFDALWQRGAGVVCLNHPRGGAYLDLVKYDSVAAQPLLQDPTVLGFPADAHLWSWNFNAIELMNGHRYIFRNPADPASRGLFDDWMGMHNIGRRITGLGSSDVHGEEGVGKVRTYFATTATGPQEFTPQQLVDAIAQGRVVIGAGAFVEALVNQEAGPGQMVKDTDGTVFVTVKVQSPPKIDVQYAKVYVNCDQVATIAATNPGDTVKIVSGVELSLWQDSHIVVAAFGYGDMPLGFTNYSPEGRPRGITNPIFVDVDGDGVFTPPGARSCQYDLLGPP